ncbi:conserved hypothetical protein [Ahrensia sp. R2A130]|nr:conserved hypothetical protein [Ahrensia sp. R2A130]
MAGEDFDMSNNTITQADHERITCAIRAAESTTSGEIFAVVAHASDDYFYVAGFMAGLWSLLSGALVWLGALAFGYDIGGGIIVSAQMAAFVLSLVMFQLRPQWRLLFVPRSVAYRRASANAVKQFLAHGIHTTQARSGVLLFVSLAERYAEIVADEGIDEHVDQSVWNTMVEHLIDHAAKGEVADGFIQVIGEAGAVLAPHFPPQPEGRNELDDLLVEI